MKNKSSFWRQLSLSAVSSTLRCSSSPAARALLLAPLALSLLATRASAQATPPSTFTQTITNGSTTLTLNFKLHSVRSSNFIVDTQATDGSLVSNSVAAPRTYLGTVTERPGAIVAGWLKADGSLWYKVIFEDGTAWQSTGGAITTSGSTSWTPAYPSLVVPVGGSGSNVYGAEVGIDATNAYYVSCGSTVANTIGMIEWSLIKTDAIYLRDAAIVMKLGRVVIRQTASIDPYVGLTSGTGPMLDKVKDQWNNVLPSSTHDLAVVVDPSGAGSGLAWVGAIGTVNRYATASSGSAADFEVTWRHEAGHNWGSNHYEGDTPEGPTIMSGNSLARFSSPELARIIAHRNTKTSILDNLGAYTYPLPPRANADRAQVVPGSTSAVIFDVLANDSDSCGKTFTITTFSATTTKGGTVVRSTGTGPGGRDQLVYTPPASITTLDTFDYRIQDSAGYQAIAKVYILPLPAAGNYNLKNVTSGLCLDNMGSTTNGSNEGQWTGPNGGNNQKFVLSYSGGYAKLMCVTGNLYMDSLGHTNTASTVGQYASSASNNQLWSMDYVSNGVYTFTNVANGLRLDGIGATTNGTAPQFYPGNTGTNQQWTLSAAP
ncbi:hypothetical protein IAD21_02460 [Abditibacteriota bacterium]|nr:hypothetical protein IAD21_02460 [Abditibacteriota bacterium]